jgi:hypothetical protein
MSSNDVPLHVLFWRRLPYIVTALMLFLFLAVTWALLDQTNSTITRGVNGTMGDPLRHWGLPGLYLLLCLPFGAMIVVFVRMIIGWQTFGLFTPMLLSLSFLQTGPLLGPTLSTGAILIGMAAAPLLKKLDLSRVAFLGVLISVVVTALAALAINNTDFSFVSAFPVVVTALVVERWWAAWEAEGLRKALKITAYTLLVALAIQIVVASAFLRSIGETVPLAIPIFSGVAIVLLGRYKGLRLTELSRFRAARGN